MIICVCHRVSDWDIARAAQAGCSSFEELQFDLSVATACGKCHDCAHETFEHHAARAGRCDLVQTCAGHTGQHKAIPIAAQRRGDSVAQATA